MSQLTAFHGNLFEIDNARCMTLDQMVQTFVPIQTFWRLLTPKHHILLGSRGSGKTAVARMLSHGHLSKLKDPTAQKIIQAKSLIGIYVPTRLKWVGGLRNKPWQTVAEKEEFFEWRLNISTCLAFLNTVQSCLAVYVVEKSERLQAELKICSLLSDAWVENGKQFESITELIMYLEDVEYNKQQQLARIRALGSLPSPEIPFGMTFGMELFEPLRKGISIVSRILAFPQDSAWLLCLDEAEFLEPFNQRILNSHMRSDSGSDWTKDTILSIFILTEIQLFCAEQMMVTLVVGLREPSSIIG